MTGDHHSQTAGTATLLVRAVDEILGTHNHVDQKGGDGEGIQAWRYGEACPVSGRRPERATGAYHRQQGCAAPERS
jgi:hypothetical protein